mmetsp:Transcript_25957/g.61073  ORF Transcript_25957/g.61073 Transcript_25957/m.61073 type:complete len:320 (+) Transcript_25957:183-1142(+)|eukprot:CAMPEP_0172394872 /NCGR_PEP_ID=MMETSP1061-20121228/17077_1 /TAXON_ID=37318 /ORGANISM="Pseudo-nitzschia pungens, Strain cf. pungens" /LENGTH=319 /DNA_ID=CAMNT_0013126323 /DNA_START=101 /DNA_END=1060 /DNA_ORIENTATION=-
MCKILKKPASEMTMASVIFVLLMNIGNIAAVPESLPSLSSKPPLSERFHSSKSLFRRDVVGELIAMRGGQTGEPFQQAGDPYQQPQYYPPSANDINSQDYENGFANYNPPSSSDELYDREAGMFQESVQDRHDKWRAEQMERYANLTQEQELNPRDEQGRMKLLSSVSKGSRALIFFILMWRDIYLFDVTDQSIKGSVRKTIARGFLTTVFLGNLAGVVTSITSQGHSAKNRLKAILNLDKVVETTLLLWNLGRVTLFPSKYVEREIFIAGILHSVMFLIQCQAFTRVTWDEKIAPVPQPQSQYRPNDQQGYTQTPGNQ